MQRTNIYLTLVQQTGFRQLAATTGRSMAALVREAINHMLAHPDQFPVLRGIDVGAGTGPGATRAASAARGNKTGAAQRRAPPKVKRTRPVARGVA